MGNQSLTVKGREEVIVTKGSTVRRNTAGVVNGPGSKLPVYYYLQSPAEQ